MEPLPAAFCDEYVAHEAHVYGAINGLTYSCPGLTAQELAAEEADAALQCEHGLRASLCGGPMHWYDIDDRC
jgi:hypothetical protein